MASQLSKGHTYNPGDVVDAPDLNALVDAAIARVTGGLVSEQTAVAAATGDYILIGDTSDSNKLKKALVSSLGVGTVTSISMTIDANATAVFSVTPGTPITNSGTFNLKFKTQTRRTFLGAPVAAGDTPSFRAIAPADLPVTTVDIAAAAIDCTLGNVFTKTLPTGAGPFNIAINNLADGQTIRVGIINNAAGTNNVAWSVDLGLFMWRGGTTPTVTATASAKDIFTFTKIVNPASTITYGYADQNFKP